MSCQIQPLPPICFVSRPSKSLGMPVKPVAWVPTVSLAFDAQGAGLNAQNVCNHRQLATSKKLGFSPHAPLPSSNASRTFPLEAVPQALKARMQRF
jgi:hypothetical protein